MKKIWYIFLSIALILFFSFAANSTVYAGESIKISEKSIVLLSQKTRKLSVTGTSKKINWMSSNKKVVKVSKTGKVQGVSEGKATIYAFAGDRVLKCKVTVPYTKTFRYDRHKYAIVNKGMKWSTAKKYCESLGGHLVTITSQKEQNAIVKNIKKLGKKKRKSYWLGAKKNSSGSFKWVTKEKFSYVKWAPQQPDNDLEKCLMIYTFDNPNVYGNDAYLWNDLINEGTCKQEKWFGLNNFGFICEWDN